MAATTERPIPTQVFQPLHVGFAWTGTKTHIDIYSIILVLPSGVATNMFRLNVISDGTELELRVEWPKALCDVHVLHRKCLKLGTTGGFTEYHPRCVKFEQALKSIRPHANDNIRGVAKLQLPFRVGRDIASPNKLILPPFDTVVIYIDLKAVDAEYTDKPNQQAFEKVD